MPEEVESEWKEEEWRNSMGAVEWKRGRLEAAALEEEKRTSPREKESGSDSNPGRHRTDFPIYLYVARLKSRWKEWRKGWCPETAAKRDNSKIHVLDHDREEAELALSPSFSLVFCE